MLPRTVNNGAFSTLSYYGRLARNHPALAVWYLRNRLRVASLARERRRPDGGSRLPRAIAFRPTSSCNLRCKMCYYAANGDVLASPDQSLSLSVWTSTVDDVARFRPYITLSGGEPLLYPAIGELIGHIKQRGLICTITTNGTLLSSRAPRFMDHPPDALVVSIDGPPHVHDELRGRPGTYERAVAGIKVVQALKRERKQKKPFLVVSCVITRYNYEHVDKMIEIAFDLGADAVNYQHQWSLTHRMVDDHNALYGHVHHISYDGRGGMETPSIEPNGIVDAVRRCRRFGKTVNGRMYVAFQPDLNDSEVSDWYADPHTWVKRTMPACAWILADILPNGDVQPCPGIVCGNITRDRFSDLWNSPAAREHRRRLAATGNLPICARCCAYFRRD